MASTSNQNDSSISSTPHCDHDVFLSFRGPDTRNSFTSHLYEALTRSGIKTFIDDEELRSGKEIKPELRKAIQGSRMSIIVFSKNYASSRWCLDELVEILECKRTNGQIVIPIFFDVEPFIVRHQRGSYAKAFEKFMEDWGPWKKLLITCLPSCIIRGWSFAKPVENNRLVEWRAALTEAANLSGHDLQNEENGNEAKFIAKIVMEVQREVNSKALNVPNLIGVDSQVDFIDTLLSIGSNDVRTIGIYGMGGIGKTTVSKAVYNKHLNHFEISAFVEDIKDVSKERGGLLGLQEKLLNQLRKYNVRLSNCDEGINLIKQSCSSKRVLILLDDLDNVDQIKKLVEHRRQFSVGSRVIIVTRDEEVLKKAQVDRKYEIKALNADESLKLFRLHAFRDANSFPFEDYKSLSIEATTYCGGLPLALEVIGGHMGQLKTPLSWKKALEEFHKYPEKTILGRLKISYDALSEHGKKIFLDVACIFIGCDKDYLVKFWDGCRFSPENSIKELLNKCLLKVDGRNCVRMHDHLRDMGRAIVLEDRSLEKYNRVWIREEILDLLQHPKGAEAVEGISLNPFNLRSIALENKAFEAMHQLRFLLINYVDVSGSFKDLFGKLRWLSWQGCPLKSLPTDFHPIKLVVLDLKHSKIEKLWEGVKHLENLKILDLSHSMSLVETPNFNGVQSLERLILIGCKRLSTIDPSICELRSLEELDLEYCSMLERLPEEFGNIKSLKRLMLRYCERLSTIAPSICELRSLEELDLEGCPMLERLPEELGNMKSLKRLMLRHCKRLSMIDPSICKLRSLEELNLENCSVLERLPKELGNMKSLKTLNISHTLLEGLPDSIGHLSRLVHLRLEWCMKHKTLPTTICNLISLEELHVCCRVLERLPEELGNLECLLDLDLSNCMNLINLPASICSLTSLEKLNVGNCLNLKRLPEAMGNLKRLRTLNASGTKLEELPDSIGHLSSLVHLNLSGCSNLKTLPDRICDLSSLEELNIDRGKQQLSLRNLDAYEIGCQQLRPLFRDPQSRFGLPFKIKSSLKTLKLINCGLHDEDIPDDIGICLLSLQFLGLSRNDFCNLPSTLCQLSNLTVLHLADCKSLVSLSELPPNLHRLHASGCTAMEKIPNLSNMKHLRTLDLSYSHRLVEVKGLENLKLWSLQMAGCRDLAMNTTFNESFFQRYFEGGCDYDVYDSRISLPKWNFQNWIIYQSMKSSISFELPPSLPDNFQGIILWVVYARFFPYFYNTVITNNTSGKEWRHDRKSHYIMPMEGHSWVSCIKSNYFKGGDSIKISILEDDYLKVEKCGVHWLIGSEGDEDENVHYCNTTYD